MRHIYTVVFLLVSFVALPSVVAETPLEVEECHTFSSYSCGMITECGGETVSSNSASDGSFADCDILSPDTEMCFNYTGYNTTGNQVVYHECYSPESGEKTSLTMSYHGFDSSSSQTSSENQSCTTTTSYQCLPGENGITIEKFICKKDGETVSITEHYYPDPSECETEEDTEEDLTLQDFNEEADFIAYPPL